jgi:hypothetical protein
MMGVFSAKLTMEAFAIDLEPLVTATADIWPSYHPYQQQRCFLGHSSVDFSC